MSDDRNSPPKPDGADLLERMRAVNAMAAFNRWIGLEVTHAEAGEVTLDLAWRDEFGQYAGFMHAGMVGALIDTAGGFAAATIVGQVLASHYDVSLYAPAIGPRFSVVGRVVRAGKRQVFARSKLFAHAEEADPKLVAAGSIILMRSMDG